MGRYAIGGHRGAEMKWSELFRRKRPQIGWRGAGGEPSPVVVGGFVALVLAGAYVALLMFGPKG
jgi:hypothetical protein